MSRKALILVLVATAASVAAFSAKHAKWRSLIEAFQCEACEKNISASEAQSWVVQKAASWDEAEENYWDLTRQWSYAAHRARSRSSASVSLSRSAAKEPECEQAPPAPKGYMLYHGYGNYKMYPKPEKWSVAQQTCQDDGGDLVVVNSDGESLVLRTLMTHFPIGTGGSTTGVFIGAQKVGDEWITIFGDILRKTGYNRWAEGRPNSNTSFCLSLTRNAEYDDMYCYEKFSFICEHFNKDLKVTLMHGE